MPFTRDTRSIFGDAAAVGKISPLTRIPALVLDDGEVLIDSAAILDHLDEQAGDAALIPPPDRAPARPPDDGTGSRHPRKGRGCGLREALPFPEHRSTDWLDRCLGQARAGLDELTRRLATPYACGPTLTHADVMITTLIWYMQDRMNEVLSPSAHADLITLGRTL
jgi:glutathione S-transferase